jgi:enamine deaminase RidA (YjgF/YER057c/UK114 family)
MQDSRDTRFKQVAQELGHSFDGEIKIGGNYVPVLQEGSLVYVSGQIPRVGDTVIVVGRVGAEVSLHEAQLAARICAMRALALLRQSLGTLDKLRQLLRVGVYVHSTESFTQQSEVADAASEVFQSVLGPAGVHTRTSIGVYQLPKNAAVELDLVAAVE